MTRIIPGSQKRKWKNEIHRGKSLFHFFLFWRDKKILITLCRWWWWWDREQKQWKKITSAMDRYWVFIFFFIAKIKCQKLLLLLLYSSLSFVLQVFLFIIFFFTILVSVWVRWLLLILRMNESLHSPFSI